MTEQDVQDFWDLYDRIKRAYKLGPEEMDAKKCVEDAYALACWVLEHFDAELSAQIVR